MMNEMLYSVTVANVRYLDFEYDIRRVLSRSSIGLHYYEQVSNILFYAELWVLFELFFSNFRCWKPIDLMVESSMGRFSCCALMTFSIALFWSPDAIFGSY